MGFMRPQLWRIGGEGPRVGLPVRLSLAVLIATTSACRAGDGGVHGVAPAKQHAPADSSEVSVESPAVNKQIAATPPDQPLRPPAAEAAHRDAQQRLLGAANLPALPPAPKTPLPAPAPFDIEPRDAATKAPTAPSERSSEPAPAPPAYFVPVARQGDNNPLAAFHDALRELEGGRDDAKKVRVLMYGASGTAADFGVGYVRLYLQARFGDGGPGFIPLGRINRWSRHNEVKIESSKGWRKEHAQWKKGRMDGHYGLLGASFSSASRRDYVRVSAKPKSRARGQWASADIHFLAQPEGGRFRVKIEGLAPIDVSTAADELGPGFHTIELPAGVEQLELRPRGDGEVRLFGVVIERAGAGVVVDTLGIGGTRLANHLRWNERVWADALTRRAPALITLSYGTNESVGGGEDVPLDRYREQLREYLGRLRATAPAASCLLITPADFPIKEGERLLPRPRLDEIVAIQRELAPEYACGLWDGQRFMGGFGAIDAWVHAEPPLARADYLHFTRRGSALKAMTLSDALMLEFDWRAQQDAPPE
jgi:lysophospholipase L1-like esterase